MGALLADLEALAARPDWGVVELVAALRALNVDELTDDLVRPDPERPYGRRVLFATPHLEAMIATWTPGVRCAPHDHGDTFGAVRVLRGRVDHRAWAVRDGALLPGERTTFSAGDVACVPDDLVHCMGDDGWSESAVTLHLYAVGIPDMVVYGQGEPRTWLVDGSCGAWIPRDRPDQLLGSVPGYVAPATARERLRRA